ncbi:MAG: CAP domain-containing protein [Burkholderiaceae bacterium]|nr:CAP domain-containing protein [Burkholderiaceae bacterium]
MKRLPFKEQATGLSIVAILTLTGCSGAAWGATRNSGRDAGDDSSQASAKIDNTCGLANFRAEILAQVNARRAAGAVCGAVRMPAVGSLAWNTQLQHAAAVHAENMAATGVYSHTGSNGLTADQRATAAGYAYTFIGENIDAQRTSVQAAINSWMGSPHHCQNIMRTQFRDIGVSCASNPASQWGNYWSMKLGRRS